MISCKRSIWSIILISLIFVSAMFQKRTYAGSDNGVESKHKVYYTEIDKQNLMEKTIECMSYGIASVVTAYKVDGQWRVEIKANDVKNNWESIDTLELQIADGMNISFSNEYDTVYVYFRDSDFQVGSVATLLFGNPSKNEYGIIFVNFSDSNDLIFQTNALKKLVAGESAIDQVYFNGETRKITVLQEQVILEEHKNTGIIPPHEIQSADGDVLLYRAYKESSGVYAADMAKADDFEVYSANAEYIRSFQSPFAAIEYIVKNDLEGSFAYETNSGREIYRYDKGRDDLYYLFDRSCFYGTASVMDATQLTIRNKYFHSIRADGIFGAGGKNAEILPREAVQPYSHSYKIISSMDNTELWVLEGNTGAYVYKKSKYGGFYTGSSSLILLSQARLRPYGDNETQYTAYAYLGLNTINGSLGEPRDPSMAIACDLGIMSGSNDAGAWFLYTNMNVCGDTVTRKEYPDDPIVTSTYLEESDEFVGNQDVYLYMGAEEAGCVYIFAINALTMKTQPAYVYNQRLDPKNDLTCYMEGTKLVPDVWDPNLPEVRVVSDINSGAYLKNLCWYRSMLYTSILGNNGKSLWGRGVAEISYILAYDDEHAWYTNLSDYYNNDVDGGIVDIHYAHAIR